MEYVDALEFCRKHKIYKDEETKEFFEFGDDIPEMPERKMVDMIGRPVFLCRFPVEMKAFYMPKAKDDPRLTESVDLLVPGVGEVIGGSMRISDFVRAFLLFSFYVFAFFSFVISSVCSSLVLL
jgi:asparaginyl-tRNA synthetase